MKEFTITFKFAKSGKKYCEMCTEDCLASNVMTLTNWGAIEIKITRINY